MTVEKTYVEAVVKKGEYLRIIVEGMESFPAEFPYHQVVEVIAESAKRAAQNDFYNSQGAVLSQGAIAGAGANYNHSNLLSKHPY